MNQNEVALKMIAEGVTKISAIVEATGLSARQIRHRFQVELLKAKERPAATSTVEAEKDGPQVSEVGAILDILQAMQKDIGAIKKDIQNLQKSLDGNWLDNPFLSGTWENGDSHLKHGLCERTDPFGKAFTGKRPSKCLVEVEYLSGKRQSGLAEDIDWSTRVGVKMIDTANKGAVIYAEYEKSPSSFELLGGDSVLDSVHEEYSPKTDPIIKYRIMQAGH